MAKGASKKNATRRPEKQARPDRAAAQAAAGRAPLLLTVGWMLAVGTTLMLEIACLSLAGLTQYEPGHGISPLQVLAQYLFFAALVIGTISLVLGVLSARVRKFQPPRGLQTFSYVVGGLPLALVLLDVGLRVLPGLAHKIF